MFVGARNGKITSSCNYLFHSMMDVFELSIVKGGILAGRCNVVKNIKTRRHPPYRE